SPVVIAHCTRWEVDDLWLEGVDDAIDTAGPVAHVTFSDQIVARGLLLMHPNRYANNNALEVGHSTNVVVEDSEAYAFFRDGFVSFLSTNVTFRRIYANGRGEPDVAGGFVTSCPGGDLGYLSFYGSAGVIEDAIVENVCAGGFNVTAGTGASGDTGVGDNHLF